MGQLLRQRSGAWGLFKLGARLFHLKMLAWRVCMQRERHRCCLGRGGVETHDVPARILQVAFTYCLIRAGRSRSVPLSQEGGTQGLPNTLR